MTSNDISLLSAIWIITGGDTSRTCTRAQLTVFLGLAHFNMRRLMSLAGLVSAGLISELHGYPNTYHYSITLAGMAEMERRIAEGRQSKFKYWMTQG